MHTNSTARSQLAETLWRVELVTVDVMFNCLINVTWSLIRFSYYILRANVNQLRLVSLDLRRLDRHSDL